MESREERKIEENQEPRKTKKKKLIKRNEKFNEIEKREFRIKQ